MRALVTGAAGFIGSTLVDRLLYDGHQVVGIDNLSTGILAHLDDARRRYRMNRRRFTFVQTDVLAPEMRDIVAGSNPDVIFHLAAQVDLRTSVIDPLFDARHNVLGTINVLEAARQCEVSRIVYAASSADTVAVSPNSVAKVAGGLYVFAYAQMYGITPICLALANVYGPRQAPRGEAGAASMFGREMIPDNFASGSGDGTAAGDYVYIDDAVDAFVRAAQTPHGTAGTYNIGTGGSVSSPCHGAMCSGELPAISSDSTKADNELGWSPTVQLREGIERTVLWLREGLTPESIALPETDMNTIGVASALQTL